MFRVIIAGSRDFDDYELLKETMDRLLINRTDEIVILSGKARGADTLGERYARERGYFIEEHPADWIRHDRAAGPIRNEQMAQRADALVAFWDGQSPGTKSMIDLARKYKLKVRVIKYMMEEKI